MKKIILYSFSLLVLTLSSCVHKTLCDVDNKIAEIRVVFDWKNAPSANPKGMYLYLFPENGSKPIMYAFDNKDGGKIKVAVGKYKALCMNSDTEAVLYRNMDKFETAEAYSPDGKLLVRGMDASRAPRPRGRENERISLQPDMLYTGAGVGYEIVVTDQEQVITLYPALSVCHYTVICKNVKNLNYAKPDRLTGALCSLAGGRVIATNTPSKELVTMSFVMNVVKEEGKNPYLKGDFYCYGQLPAEGVVNGFTLYAVMTDKQRYPQKPEYTDVTDQVRNAPNPYEVLIVIDNEIKLPDPIAGDGGIHISVDDWASENIDLQM